MAITFVVLATVGFLLAFRHQASADTAPALTAGSPITGNTDTFLPIAGVQLEGDVVGSAPIALKVDSGILRLGTTTGLTFTGSSTSTGKTITFTGSKTAINNALATLTYRSNSPAAANFTASIGSEDMVYYPGNGHVYEVVHAGGPISWTQANAAAEARTFNGADGYLATITDQAENDYITARMSGDGWFGASDAETEDRWLWVSGPEAGTHFWQGLGSFDGGAPVDGLFSNWADGEPNNAGDEDCAQFYGSGSGWNDLPCDATLESYVVEYGDDEVQPTAPSSTTFTITTTQPAPSTVVVDACQDFFDGFVGDNSHRYDTISLSQDLDCTGYTLPALFSEEDPESDEGEVLGFKGTFNGNNHTIRNLKIESNFYTDQYGDERYSPTGLFGYIQGGTVSNLKLENSVAYSNGECTGTIAGRAWDLTISNVSVNGTVTDADGENSSEPAGGLVGCLDSNYAGSTIANSSFAGSVVLPNADQIGGIVGVIQSTYTLYPFSLDEVVSDATVSGEGSVGGIVGSADVYDGTPVVSLTNVTSKSTVTALDDDAAGGIIGRSFVAYNGKLIIDGATVLGAVNGRSQVGGVGGSLSVSSDNDDSSITVKNITVSAPVTASQDRVGGVVGYASAYVYSSHETAFTLEDINVTGAVTGDVDNVGGVVGELYAESSYPDTYALSINRARTSGAVTSTTSGSVGGIAGFVEGASINESYATGSITGDGDSVGGLVGILQLAEITNSYARGSVSASNAVGGLVGHVNNATVENSYTTGQVQATSVGGGLVALLNGAPAVTNSYYDSQTTGQVASAAGTARATALMTKKANYPAWDFEAVWAHSARTNDGYPCLQWTGTCEQDGDTDSISDAVEVAAPNNGDGNADGIADSLQNNVASFVNPVTGKYVTLEISGSCSISDVSVVSDTTIGTKDGSYEYKNGLFDFTASSCTTGGTITVKQYYHGVTSTAGMTVRKYNPVTGEFQTVTGHNLTLGTQNVAGQNIAVLQYSVTDGGELDTDGVANGEIVDPIGLATIAGAPNTGVLSMTKSSAVVMLFVTVALAATVSLAIVLIVRRSVLK